MVHAGDLSHGGSQVNDFWVDQNVQLYTGDKVDVVYDARKSTLSFVVNDKPQKCRFTGVNVPAGSALHLAVAFAKEGESVELLSPNS